MQKNRNFKLLPTYPTMQFSEILKMSLTAIRSNKLRSALTLLGIIVGVFSIIGVMTAVQILQNSIEVGLSGLGTNTFQIQKQPVMANRTQWMKSLKWKDITYEQAKAVKERMTLAQYVGIGAFDRCRNHPIWITENQSECRSRRRRAGRNAGRTTGQLRREEISRMMT